MDVTEHEEAEGVRFVWNAWPVSRVDASKMVIPLAVAVTPLRRLPAMPVLEYEPVVCRTCPGVLNPYASVDFQSLAWACPICGGRNGFPQHYASISPEHVPAELYSSHTALEYRLPSRAKPRPPPAFVFLLDLALEPAEIEGLKRSVQQALSLMPDSALVGVITFGARVLVHELGSENMPKAFCLRGDRALERFQFVHQLRLGGSGAAGGSALYSGATGGARITGGSAKPPPPPPPPSKGRGHPSAPPPDAKGQPASPSGSSRAAASTAAEGSACGGRFLAPLSSAGFALDSLLEGLEADSPLKPGQRPQRATGAAIAAGAALLRECRTTSGGRLLLLTGGPATVGPGQVADIDRGDSIRTHQDIDRGDARLYSKAAAFYEGIGTALAAAGHTLDVFAAALDQVGLAELRTAVSDSGGVMILGETFDHPTFRRSLGRVFASDPDGHLDCGFNATLEVIAPKDIAVAGAIGSVAGVRRDDGKGRRAVTEVPMGEGGVTAWLLCCLSPRSTVTVFFEVTSSHAAPAPVGGTFVLQFTLRYCHPDGSERLRVITVARVWASASGDQLADSFDQGAAAAAVSRLAAYKAASEDGTDVVRWVDRSVISLCKRFGSFQNDDAASFLLPPGFQLFPQFMYHLRRSQFLQVFNNTPDETAFYRLWLERETTGGVLTMVQPALTSYGIGLPPEPVLLDVSSIQADRALVMDTFFMVLIFYGNNIAAWAAGDFQHQPGYESFAELLAAVAADAAESVSGRLPAPMEVTTKQGGSQARFLLAKTNPSATHDTNSGYSEEFIFTDDVSLQVFLEHLAKVVATT